jgi:NAD(P)-dependent dehydrogenase (short-subunit alcohol dehydrogenase family)
MTDTVSSSSPEIGPQRLAIMERFRLDGKVAVVTGASAGLGVSFAGALAEAGADVALGARRADRLAETQAWVTQLGRRAVSVPTDVTSPEDCDGLVGAAMQAFGRVDILVNNAGTSDAAPALKQSADDFRRVVDINLHGSYWMARACGRVMQPGSSIINISSVIGLSRGVLPSAGYASSKAAIIGLTRDLANQWTSRHGIRVNALAPGFVETELTAPLIERQELLDTVLARTPMGRLAEPAEICGPLIFLASDASSYLTGITLPVDGGWAMP